MIFLVTTTTCNAKFNIDSVCTYVMLLVCHLGWRHSSLYTVSQKKPDTCDIFKYLQQIMTNINNFWYRESSIHVQSTDVKLPCEI